MTAAADAYDWVARVRGTDSWAMGQAVERRGRSREAEPAKSNPPRRRRGDWGSQGSGDFWSYPRVGPYTISPAGRWPQFVLRNRDTVTMYVSTDERLRLSRRHAGVVGV